MINLLIMINENELENSVTIVSGIPRSGTSLVMQMLAAAGITIFTDDKNYFIIRI